MDNNNLYYYRTKANLTQAQLAELSGVHKMKISKLERGVIQPKNITLETAVKLAAALNIAPQDLLVPDPEE